MSKELMMSPKQTCMELAKRLTALRLYKAWTREILAKNANINVHTLKRFERSGQISLERLVAICQALDNHHDIERLFKPRHRVDVDNWQPVLQTTRKRGKRNTGAREIVHKAPIDQLITVD